MKTNNLHESSNEVFRFSQNFNAPVSAVFQAFQDPEALNAWWGPAESVNSVISLDFKPGGTFRYRMEYNGVASYGRFLFSKIEQNVLLEFSNAFTDANGQVIHAPFDIRLPKEIYYVLRFSEKDGQTTLAMTGTPMSSDPAELSGFASIADSMQTGFGATFARLAAWLQSSLHN
ncbi:SRPBCC domain-containing protein [Pedobacter sp. SYP-B3415]|uniref:SRPBCC family protein n=1 Tax=Pedobacter sp. SYP-B3415 TaxID=2496641 RepID=UPI00101C7A22|nr:SRPBCC domain-containing protein [Pedobacter sp. SYP-B3415]